jgi:hypothetical protein
MYWPNLQQHFSQQLFPGQQDSEEIFLVMRQHWVTFALRLAVWLIFVVILILADWLIPTYAPFLLESPYVEIWSLVKSVYLMLLLLGLFILWIIYYLNLQIITNERVVDIDQHSLLHHKISELYLSRVQDVTAEVRGFLPTFFNYGNVYIQTAGETERFTFSNISNPTSVSKLILDLYEKLPEEARQRGRAE